MTQILIEGYELDIYEGIGALFTYQVDDVSSFAKKNTAFSKTITIPATATNRKLLGFVEDLNINLNYSSGLPNVLTNYNAGVPANCIVLIDSIQVFKGIIRVLEITNTNGLVEYQCSVFGELGGFFFNLTNKYLSDLDFSAYNQNWTWSNVSASWNNVGSGAFFGLGDYGNCSIEPSPPPKLKHDWKYEAFRPAFFLKEYLEKIFDVSKYSVDMSALTGISWFDRLVIPHNQDDMYLPAILTSTYTGSNNNAQYFRDTFTYVNGTTGDLYISFQLNLINYNQIVGTTAVTVDLMRNGVTVATVTAQWFPTDPIGTSKLLQFAQLETSVLTNTEFYVRIQCNTTANFIVNQNAGILNVFDISSTTSTGATLFSSDISSQSMILYTLTPTWLRFEFKPTITFYDIVTTARYNDYIDMNFALPKNIKLTDFVTSVLKLFNCMIIEDKDTEKGLKVIPYIDYYYPLPTAIDWSNKIDRKTAFKIKPMSELNARYYEFRYDVDSDWINTVYKEKYGIGYGEKVFDSEYQFSKDKSEAKVIFSPSPMWTVSGEDKVFPIFWKSTDNGTTEGRMGTKIRLLFSNKLSVDSWQMHLNTGHHDFDQYGYMGHYNNPDSPTFDLNWETPRELYFSFNREVPPNLFNSYWSAYLAEITHKDSKLLVANVYLTKMDIKNLDFSKPIYIDGVIFRLNKVVDYNSEQEGLTKVELLKLNL